ncbi:MAG: adenine phosphoribosyltransferase [Planctomycetota bacterium]
MDLAKFIRDIPDFPKPGIRFKDITPLLASPQAFHEAIHRLVVHYMSVPFDAIAAAEARGFLIAAPLALHLNKPLVPLRKPGKLPYATHKMSYDLEYGSAELHVHIDGFEKGAKVLLVDDVLATGGTMKAAVELIEKSGASVVSIAVLIELAFLAGRDKLPGHDIVTLLTY